MYSGRTWKSRYRRPHRFGRIRGFSQAFSRLTPRRGTNPSRGWNASPNLPPVRPHGQVVVRILDLEADRIVALRLGLVFRVQVVHLEGQVLVPAKGRRRQTHVEPRERVLSVALRISVREDGADPGLAEEVAADASGQKVLSGQRVVLQSRASARRAGRCCTGPAVRRSSRRPRSARRFPRAVRCGG